MIKVQILGHALLALLHSLVTIPLDLISWAYLGISIIFITMHYCWIKLLYSK